MTVGIWYNIKAFELPSVSPTRVNASRKRCDIKAGGPLTGYVPAYERLKI